MREGRMSAYPYLAELAPTPVEGVKQATRRAGNLQAGTVKVGDDLTIYYSYSTAIGFAIAGGRKCFTDAYYSTRTEAHAAEFGIREPDAVITADPLFRLALVEACRVRGLPTVPRADFTRIARETSFADSPFFSGKRQRGQHPRAGSYVYVVRDRLHFNGCEESGREYRIKAVYMGLVKADDPDKGWRKGQRKIRPIHAGYGEATEAVDSALCQTEGGAESFPED
jgi:hypothetical protein